MSRVEFKRRLEFDIHALFDQFSRIKIIRHIHGKIRLEGW